MKRRKDCYFGLHFDFHANEFSKDIGSNFSPSLLEKIITEVKPDFIQCDCKGHPGYCDYPSKVGSPAPGLSIDLIKAWKEISAKHDVPLFAHYSGVYDAKACKDHSEWARVDENGLTSDLYTSPFSRYVDEILIPMMDELASNYKLNGAWIDGDCWCCYPDYSDKAKQLYKKQTGNDFDKNNLTPYLTFNREGFKNYVTHYCKIVKEKHPDFDITSNWMNTSWLPDDINATDYISGDLSPTNSVDSARFDGRVMAMFDRPWDIMSWGISFPIHYMKSALMLEQEASIILSLGGGFQIYNMQDPKNTVMDEWGIQMWKEVSNFVRNREKACHHGKPIEDVAFIYSVSSYYASLDKDLFLRNCPYNLDLYGNLLNVLDRGKSVSFIHEDKDTDYSKYSLICISNSKELKGKTIEKLEQYVSNGGSLLLLGPDTFRQFSSFLKIEGTCKYKEEEVISRINRANYALELRKPYVEIDTSNFGLYIELESGTVDGDLKVTNPPPSISFANKHKTAFGLVNIGKGKIGVLPIEIGKLYLEEKTFELSLFFADVLDMMGKTKLESDSNGRYDSYLTKKDGKEYLHLINLLGEHRCPNNKTFDYIPGCLDLNIGLNLGKKITKIVDTCSDKEIEFKSNGNEISIHLDKLDLYSILEIR